MSLKPCILPILLLVSLPLSAQVDEALEQMAVEFDDATQVSGLADEMVDWQNMHINLNDTTQSHLPLLSPFQLKALKNYITLYGQLLSFNELYLIPGFDSTTVASLKDIAVIEPVDRKGRWRLSDGRHNLITGIGGTLEQAAGYSDGRYDGDPLKANLVYSYNLHNHINVRLAADKDPTEQWGKGNFYGYHLMVSDIGRIKRMIVGRYNLQFGQGVTLWTGLAPFNLLGETPLRFERGIRPASTFYEEGYQEGAAATIRLLHSLNISAFASKSHGIRLLGGRIEYRGNNLLAGITIANTALDDSISPPIRVYNIDYFRGDNMTNVGIDAIYQWQRLTVYAELSADKDIHMAGIGGVRMVLDDHNSLGISYRSYSTQYHNLMTQPYGIGDGRNENGWRLDAKARLPLKVDALASLDLHSFPSLRYGNYRPSNGIWLRALLNREFGRTFKVALRYAYRMKERNVPYSDSATYVGEQTLRQQLQGEMRIVFGNWQMNTRAAISEFESENEEKQKGWALMQQARYTYNKLQITASAALFKVDGYYARIYLTENNLQYNFTMPSFYGRGFRALAIVNYNITKSLTLAAKYAVTHYLDRESVGSGAAETQGPDRQTVFVQVRLKF